LDTTDLLAQLLRTFTSKYTHVVAKQLIRTHLLKL